MGGPFLWCGRKRYHTQCWAGELRSKILAKGRRARLGDALIAQSCVDHGVPLLTRDRDFRAFAETAGLNLASKHS